MENVIKLGVVVLIVTISICSIVSSCKIDNDAVKKKLKKTNINQTELIINGDYAIEKFIGDIHSDNQMNNFLSILSKRNNEGWEFVQLFRIKTSNYYRIIYKKKHE
jgi:ribosome-interacting GTPase 1